MESKDSQNPYSTGVLVANHVEDRFGQDLITGEVKNYPSQTEVQANYSLANTMYQGGRDNFAQKPVTEEEIEAEEGYKEYEKSVINNKQGESSHLLFGHGPTQDAFEKRDFGTTNQLFFDKKMKTETLINPHLYHDIKDKRDFFVTNAKPEDTPTLFGPKLGKTFGRKTQKF
mmetsp:Transcript_1060/g.932  ORF Transcript_1060/g.932 Transcript_1060/m.932 type:complete len:172 (+) Transcript_1060:38-553(+)